MPRRMRREVITSPQNPKILLAAALRVNGRSRRGNGLFVVEGRRETTRCLEAGFIPKALFVCSEIISEGDLEPLAVLSQRLNPSCVIYEISPALYEKIAYRGGTEGVVAEIEYKERRLEDIVLGENPLVVVLEGVEKPGNLGAVLRSADAAGADAVIACDPLTDLYNPNLIRASIGAVFSRQMAVASSEDTLAWLRSKGLRILTAQLQDSDLYYHTSMTDPTAIVLGTESTGLTDFWRGAADARIRIPMLGSLDSLNLSVSAAILLFEAVRQRQ